MTRMKARKMFIRLGIKRHGEAPSNTNGKNL